MLRAANPKPSRCLPHGMGRRFEGVPRSPAPSSTGISERNQLFWFHQGCFMLEGVFHV